MEEIVNAVLTSPEQITFGLLFVGLLVWVMRTNNLRELRYQETISELSKAFGDMENIKVTVDKIHEKIN